MAIARERSPLESLPCGLSLAERLRAACDDKVERTRDDGVWKVLGVGQGSLERLGVLTGGLERSGARCREILLVDGVDLEENTPKLLRFCKPLHCGLGAAKHGEGKGSVAGELIAESRLLDLAERRVRVIESLKCREGSIGRDLHDREYVVRIRMAPAGCDFARDVTRRGGVRACVIELADRPERDGKVTVRAHAGESARGRTLERHEVVTRCRARIGEPHREVSEGHRDRYAPSAILDALGNMLCEAKGGLRLFGAVETKLELGRRQVEIELFA